MRERSGLSPVFRRGVIECSGLVGYRVCQVRLGYLRGLVTRREGLNCIASWVAFLKFYVHFYVMAAPVGVGASILEGHAAVQFEVLLDFRATHADT